VKLASPTHKGDIRSSAHNFGLAKLNLPMGKVMRGRKKSVSYIPLSRCVLVTYSIVSNGHVFNSGTVECLGLKEHHRVGISDRS
jgi:hypothetical protein